ncbi:aminoglycoside adenylyltransferase domain-containing protein [Paenibacillus nasutitermitis]|nr:aminoglycoside adenylyltransferase domain-containing protein [Paenibacillus nasutitermitis]
MSHDLDQITALFQEELCGNLIGVYLHGSLAMGCFNPKRSDIDVLVVAREKLGMDNKKAIIRRILSLQEGLPCKGGIELSVVQETQLKDFVYPTPVELHYSNAHREKYQADENYCCGDYGDYDLASQYAVAYHRGKVLYGQPLQAMYEPVGRRLYLSSILHDSASASEDIADNPVYVVLNLCRVLYFLKEGVISSKKEGGDWAVKLLPGAYSQLVQQCMSVYEGHKDKIGADHPQLMAFAVYMEHEIRQQLDAEETV